MKINRDQTGSALHIALLPKNTDTYIPKNYRPIVFLNISINYEFLFIVSCEQERHNNTRAGCWSDRCPGNSQTILINKNILSEVKGKRRNLYTLQLDYIKAFDSIPHSWLTRALKLDKVPKHLVNAIKNMRK